ncbi:MAG: metallophosphoesterase [Pseudomonadota bacterium]
MRILCVSDVVEPSLYPDLDRTLFDDIQMVLACGDLPPEYVGFLYHVLNVPCLYVMGNHDLRYGSRPPMGCVNIHARIVTVRGLRIMGLEGSRWYNGGPNQYTEAGMRRILRKMTLPLWWHRGVDIVITHAPPLHIHDAPDRCHRGFECFRTLIDKKRPPYLIHGHIHRQFNSPEERVTVVNTTKVINAYGYTIIELPDGQTP